MYITLWAGLLVSTSICRGALKAEKNVDLSSGVCGSLKGENLKEMTDTIEKKLTQRMIFPNLTICLKNLSLTYINQQQS